jgi:hypothetical protein
VEYDILQKKYKDADNIQKDKYLLLILFYYKKVIFQYTAAVLIIYNVIKLL